MSGWMAGLEVWLAGLGGWAYVLAPAVMAGVSILPIPAEAPAMANGALFGPVVGSAFTWTGAMVGAWLSYEIARGWGRPLLARWVDGPSLARVERVADSGGWWGLLVLRLIPLVAFTALNWGSGAIGIPRWRFLWTTALGILPGAILFTSTGVGLVALYQRSPSIAALVGVLALSVVAVAVRSSRSPAE